MSRTAASRPRNARTGETTAEPRSFDLAREHASAPAQARLALSRVEAAEALGISLDAFEDRVQPHVRVCKIGRRVVVPVAELHAWLDRNSAVYGSEQ